MSQAILANQTFGRLLHGSHNLRQRGPASRTNCGVLGSKKFLGLGRPRHQFTIEAGPVGAELRPEAAGLHRCPYSGKEVSLQLWIGKESAASTGIDDPSFTADNAESLQSRLLAAADDHYGT